jgi:hypothetical protein
MILHDTVPGHQAEYTLLTTAAPGYRQKPLSQTPPYFSNGRALAGGISIDWLPIEQAARVSVF